MTPRRFLGSMVAAGVAVACLSSDTTAAADPMLLVEVIILVAMAAWVIRLLFTGIEGAALARTLQAQSEPAARFDVPFRRLRVAGRGAFALGLVAPRIYVSRDLEVMLNDDELRGVLLHEEHHRATRAPLRGAALLAWLSVLGGVAPVRAQLTRRLADLECFADAHALGLGVSPATLASALLKTAGARPADATGARPTDATARAFTDASAPRGGPARGRRRATDSASEHAARMGARGRRGRAASGLSSGRRRPLRLSRPSRSSARAPLQLLGADPCDGHRDRRLREVPTAPYGDCEGRRKTPDACRRPVRPLAAPVRRRAVHYTLVVAEPAVSPRNHARIRVRAELARPAADDLRRFLAVAPQDPRAALTQDLLAGRDPER